MPYKETAEVFGDDGERLRGCLHWPVRAVLPHGLVMCYPFGEERKSSARVMTWAAREFCHRGFHVLRFDYYGTGESDGRFEEASVRRWVLDIGRARRHLINRTGLADAGLVGVRFGATLAVLSDVGDQPLPLVVLWAPIMSGKACVDECLRHLAATRLVVDEACGVEGVSTASGEDCRVDMGGYWLLRSLRNELEAIDLPGDAMAKAENVVVVNFSSRALVPRTSVDLCDRLVCPRGSGKAVRFSGRPFWVTASRYDPRGLVAETIRILDECSWAGLSAGLNVK